MDYLKNKKKIKLFFSVSIVLSCTLLSGCIDMASNEAKNRQVAYKNAYVNGQVYTMRGGLGGIFSKGMNRLQDKLTDYYHINSYSTIWYKQHALSDSIIKQYKARKIHPPIILVGHSLGANDQIKVARSLWLANIPVALLITVDAISPLTVPPNVKSVVNIYYPAHVPIFSGQAVRAMDPEYTSVDNYNVSTKKDMNVNHFNIESNRLIQQLMVDKILAVIKPANAIAH